MGTQGRAEHLGEARALERLSNSLVPTQLEAGQTACSSKYTATTLGQPCSRRDCRVPLKKPPQLHPTGFSCVSLLAFSRTVCSCPLLPPSLPPSPPLPCPDVGGALLSVSAGSVGEQREPHIWILELCVCVCIKQEGGQEGGAKWG